MVVFMSPQALMERAKSLGLTVRKVKLTAREKERLVALLSNGGTLAYQG